jgi:DNA modification methylase
MFCLTKNNLAWIKIAKNACSSWQHALQNDGWSLENLSDYQGRWHEKTWIGFLRDPDTRHTTGIVQFLHNAHLLHILDHPEYSKIVCSLLVDEHTYSMHHLIPYELIQITNWFVIDHAHFNYETLVRNFCQLHGINIPPIARLNQSSELLNFYKLKVKNIKENNLDIRSKAQKNYLERDVFLYARAVQSTSKYDT